MLPLCPAPGNTPRKTTPSTWTDTHGSITTSHVPTGIQERISKSRWHHTGGIQTDGTPGSETKAPNRNSRKDQQIQVCTDSITQVAFRGMGHQGVRQRHPTGITDNMCMAGGEWLWGSEHQHNKPCNSWLAGHRCTAGRAEGDKHNTFWFGRVNRTKKKVPTAELTLLVRD